MKQQHIDIGLAFLGAALGTLSDLDQYGGKIGIGPVVAAIAVPAIAHKVRELITNSQTKQPN